MKIWRSGAAAVVWAGVLLQFWLMVHGRPPAEAAHAIVKFFSFFTVLSNIAVGAVLAAPVLASDRALGRWAVLAGSRVAVGVYSRSRRASITPCWRVSGGRPACNCWPTSCCTP